MNDLEERLSDSNFHRLFKKVCKSPRMKQLLNRDVVNLALADESACTYMLMDVATAMCKDFNKDSEVSFMVTYTVFCMICDNVGLSEQFKLSAFDIF